MSKCVDCQKYLGKEMCQDPNRGATYPYEEACCDRFVANSQTSIYRVIDTAAKIRTFNTGATRDVVEGKLSYVKALSPLVLRRYVQYIGKHRKQSDGSLRDWNNWKQGIPADTYLDSLGRHFVDTWLLTEGYSAEDNHGPVDLESVLCAIIFNASGYLHEILKEKI